MHETGIAEGIIEALRKVQAGLDEPIRIARLEVSELGGISPEHLAEHFYEAAEGTEFENVKLEAEVRGIMAKCEVCDAEFEVTEDTEACPECRSKNVSVQAHDAIKLVSVE